MLRICIISSLVLLSACASKQEPKIVKLNPVYEKDGLICEHTKRTGSNLKKARCWTKKGYEDFKKASQEFIRNRQISGMAPKT